MGSRDLFASEGKGLRRSLLPLWEYWDDRLAAAKVVFDDSGTASILKATDVDSITDHGTGDYTINVTPGALEDANYSVHLQSRGPAANALDGIENMDTVVRTTTALRVYSIRYDGVLVDTQLYSATFYR